MARWLKNSSAIPRATSGYPGYQQRRGEMDPFRNPRDLFWSVGRLREIAASPRRGTADRILILTSSGADDVRGTGVLSPTLPRRCAKASIPSSASSLLLPRFFLLSAAAYPLFPLQARRARSLLAPPETCALGRRQRGERGREGRRPSS